HLDLERCWRWGVDWAHLAHPHRRPDCFSDWRVNLSSLSVYPAGIHSQPGRHAGPRAEPRRALRECALAESLAMALGQRITVYSSGFHKLALCTGCATHRVCMAMAPGAP